MAIRTDALGAGALRRDLEGEHASRLFQPIADLLGDAVRAMTLGEGGAGEGPT